jgi:ornithine cyclodeaminase/alanine dehydrogenase-like protein (mu-crystallin family)
LRITGGGSLGLGFMGISAGGLVMVYQGRGVGSGLLAMMGSGYGNLRIGAAAGLGAKYLARKDSRAVGQLGSGRLAMVQLQGLSAVRPIEHVKIFSPTPEHRATFAERASAELKIPVVAVDSFEEAIKDVDIISSATSSYNPILREEHLRPGVHVNAVGTPNELDASVYLRADQFVTPSIQQELKLHEPITIRPNQPESSLHMLLRTGQWSLDQVIEIGRIINGEVAPKTGSDVITVHHDPQGGAGDIALAHLAYQRAKERGIGTEFEF